jgi:AraC-like DNA-binding protein
MINCFFTGKMSLNFVSLLNTITIFLLIFFSLFLIINKKGKTLSNRLFAVFLLSNAVTLSNYLLLQHPSLRFPGMFQVVNLGNSLVYLWGPILFFYIKSWIYRDFHLQKRHLVHLVPFFIYFLYIVYKLAIIPQNILQDPRTAIVITHPLEKWVFGGLLHVLLLSYTLASFLALQGYRRQTKNILSTLNRFHVSWLVFVLAAFSFLWGNGILNFFLAKTTGSPAAALSLANFFILFVMANMAVYQGLRQPEIFAGLEAKTKYEKSTLTDQDAERHLIKLKDFMKKERPYLDPNLTLYKLSKKISISPRHLSQILNEKLSQNFFDFINRYRVEEAKRYLLASSNGNKSILNILLETGFNSKSAFNRVFKKYIGLTPSRYKKTHRF